MRRGTHNTKSPSSAWPAASPAPSDLSTFFEDVLSDAQGLHARIELRATAWECPGGVPPTPELVWCWTRPKVRGPDAGFSP